MTTYKVRLANEDSFYLAVDMTQTDAPIRACFVDPIENESWASTPFQTADAQHYIWGAAKLVAEWAKELPNDCTEVEEVEIVQFAPGLLPNLQMLE